MDEFESWTIKRTVSPEPLKTNSNNLDRMQENLIVAAHTIEALKHERDRLKQSMKFSLGQSEIQTSSSTLPEIEDLKGKLNFKEQIILKLESQLTNERIRKSDWTSMQENLSNLRSELTEKEKHIISLEKIVRELKTDLHSHLSSNLIQETKEKNSKLIEDLQFQVNELRAEKKYWKKLQGSLQGVISDYTINKGYWDKKGRSEWEVMAEVVLYMKKMIEDRAGEGVNERSGANEREQLMRYKDLNEKLMSEVEYLKEKNARPGVLFELGETCLRFITKLRESPQFYLPFQRNLNSFAGFRELVDKKKYSEGLLGLMKFVIEILETGFDVKKRTFEKTEDYKTQAQKFSNFKGAEADSEEYFTERPRFYSPANRPRNETEWTGTWTEVKKKEKEQEKKIIKGGVLGSSKSNKALQTSLPSGLKKENFPVKRPLKDFETASKKIQTADEGFYKPRPNEFTKKDFETPTKPPETPKRPLETPVTPHRKNLRNAETSTERPQATSCPVEPPAKDQGYIKLFDESDQLLTIIDKQNTRLAKINNQISNLVPGSLESLDESSSDSETPKALGSYLLNLPHPNSNQYEEGTFNKHASSIQGEIKGKHESSNEKHMKILVSNPKDEVNYSQVYTNFERKGPESSSEREKLFKNTENPTEDSRFLHSSVEKSSTDHEGNYIQRKTRDLVFEYKGDSEEFHGMSNISSPRLQDDRSKSNFSSASKLKSPSNLHQKPLERFSDHPNLNPKNNKDEHWNSIIDYFSNKGDDSQ